LFFDRSGATQDIFYVEVLPPPGQKFSKGNPVQEHHLEDALAKLWSREESETSWFISSEEAAANRFDLSARNPHRLTAEELPSAAEVLGTLIETEREVLAILEDVDALMQGDGEI
jgi:type I restriction enzyme M protein